MTFREGRESGGNDMPIVTPLDWDTEFFGVPIGRLDVPGATLSRDTLAGGLGEARRRGLACLYFETPFARSADLAGFGGRGIHLVDIKTLLARPLDPAEGSGEEEGVIDRAPAERYSELESIAEDLALRSRFRYDPHFGESGSRRLYREWLRKSVHEGFCSDFLVSLDPEGVRGFLTVRMKDRSPFIDLLGAARRARGRGVSGRLIRAAGRRLARRGSVKLSVVTQAHNIPALRAYEKSGFTVQSVNLFYHLWPGEMSL